MNTRNVTSFDLKPREAKEEFFRIFDSALNGVIETRFMRDTAEVRRRKDQFFGTFDSAVSTLLTTVERAYLEVITT